MRKVLILLLSVFALDAFAQPQVKIGVIDAQEVVMKSRKGVQIQKQLETMQKTKQNQIKTMQDNVKELERQVLSPTLSAEIREQKGTELQAKRTELVRFVEDAQREMQMESQKVLLELEKELMPLIDNYGKSNGFTVIYDRARSGIVYLDTAIDITADIIREADARP